MVSCCHSMGIFKFTASTSVVSKAHTTLLKLSYAQRFTRSYHSLSSVQKYKHVVFLGKAFTDQCIGTRSLVAPDLQGIRIVHRCENPPFIQVQECMSFLQIFRNTTAYIFRFIHSHIVFPT